MPCNISLQGKTVIRRELEIVQINETGVFSTWNVAHLYLGMDRAIPYPAPYPASIGYHPGRNALIAMPVPGCPASLKPR